MESRKALVIFVLLCSFQKCCSDCGRGFVSKGGTCTDIDECKEDVEQCGIDAVCINTRGSFYCQCKQGYQNLKGPINFTAQDGQCKDLNECLVEGICGQFAACGNLIGSYMCSCISGFTRSHDGNCTDIDECAEAERTHIDICGEKGSCKNVVGSYRCKCQKGYTNYGNQRTPCSELDCETFKTNGASGEHVGGLANIFSLMRNSCLALSSQSPLKPDGDTLLEKLFTATETILSAGQLEGSEDVHVFLSTVENSVRLIGPQLKGNRTKMETNETDIEIAMERGPAPPTGPIHLSTENASLDTDWTVAAGLGPYPGFALAALLSYKNLESSLNQSFHALQGHAEDEAKPTYQVFSRVVSVVVSNPSTENLSHPVEITLRHLQDADQSSEVSFVCAYWSDQGVWSKDGCDQLHSNATHTVCSCQHLSSFAVLMALTPIEHTFELQLITKIGLSISLICLVLCILTFKFCRSIQGTRTTIHLHLCICLFLADLIFLVGITQTNPEGGCRFVAAMLHLFFLGVFAWMLLEGVQLYRMVVRVFNATIQPLYLYLVGYGAPLAIVIISAISRPKGYGTQQYCWLSLDDGLIWSFFGPVCFIIFLNVFFFIVTVWKLAQKFSSLNPDLSKLNKIKAFTVTAVAQMCVLGLMWVFGTFLYDKSNVVAAYVFSILNSLQGVLVFVMHCLLSKQVRDEYANFFSCICTPQKKRYSDFSSTNPSSSQSQGSRSGQHTGESQI
ncbi:adhesion G protein-coupled receptor E5-like [Synchiropus picturatus]